MYLFGNSQIQTQTRQALEKIEHFFKQLGDRFKSPFFFSLLMSWLISNYKLFVGFSMYSHDQLKQLGFDSYFDFVEKTISFTSGVVYPLLGAIGYTLLSPLVKMGVGVFYTYVGKIQEKRELSILEGGAISTEKYLRLRESYKQSQADLVKVIEDERTFLGQRNDLNEQINNLRKDLDASDKKVKSLHLGLEELETIKAHTYIDFLTGEWEGSYEGEKGGTGLKLKINLSKTDVLIDSEGLSINNVSVEIESVMRNREYIFLKLIEPNRLPANSIGSSFLFKGYDENQLRGKDILTQFNVYLTRVQKSRSVRYSKKE